MPDPENNDITKELEESRLKIINMINDHKRKGNILLAIKNEYNKLAKEFSVREINDTW